MLPPAPREQSPDEFRYHDAMNNFCMGFDNATNEYKIVHTYKSVTNSMVTEIYTLDTSPVPAHGHIHWRISNRTRSPDHNIDERKLLSFDVNKEEYKLTTLPQLRRHWSFTLFNMKKSLAVSDVIYDSNTVGYDIWILKDYKNQEWVKQYTMIMSCSLGLNVIGAWQDGVRLFSGIRNREIFYYDPKTNRLATIVSPSNTYGGTIISCATSLVSLKNYGELKH
ncbi:uncharacterized protein LOC119981963 [Tripterygium wilfordii]|uniref:uncharacterized protein LOC119981963 n=1 Tax=Tripterygium wilfordii TaxID=458696 RepID=UPI0018F854D1|nr:uncharacterized protein LOC119981963 [Tripterygium wilfordii]